MSKTWGESGQNIPMLLLYSAPLGIPVKHMLLMWWASQ